MLGHRVSYDARQMWPPHQQEFIKREAHMWDNLHNLATLLYIRGDNEKQRVLPIVSIFDMKNE